MSLFNESRSLGYKTINSKLEEEVPVRRAASLLHTSHDCGQVSGRNYRPGNCVAVARGRTKPGTGTNLATEMLTIFCRI